MTSIILLFPGQGSQTPGMGRELHDAFPEARAVFEECEDATRHPIRRICFEADVDVLRETQNAQLALLAHGAAMTALLRGVTGVSPVAAAGHSVGEYAALHSAGALTLPDVASLVHTRGNAMAGAGTVQPGAMAALIGELQPGVEELCESVTRPGSVVVAANYNAPGQVVVSGHIDAVERCMATAGDYGARKVVKLNVSGAFHSPLMADAQEMLSDALSSFTFTDPSFGVFSNVTADKVTDGSRARALLETQLLSPVRWVELVVNLEQEFPETLCLEVGPGSVLAGLMKRSAKSLRVLPCSTPNDLDSLAKALS